MSDQTSSKTLTGTLQECLLCLVAFDEQGQTVKSLVPLSLWEGHYKRIAAECYNYWDSYRQCPGEHTLDLIERLGAEDSAEDSIFKQIYHSMLETSPGLNKVFVLDQATKFIRQQKLKALILQAVDLVQNDELDEAERTLTTSLTEVAQMTDPGLPFSNPTRVLAALFADRPVSFPTGIPQLDYYNAGPTRKELSVFVAPPGRGKSWWLIHLGKNAVRHRLRVVHVTLEMSEARVAGRYCQSFFAIGPRPETLNVVRFETDEHGRYCGFSDQEIYQRPSFQDDNIQSILRTKLEQFKQRCPLIIKQFPTGSLTIPELERYLSALWLSEHFMPDLLVIDYADLMQIDARNYRHELSCLYKDLRGLAVSCNIAIATASQGNRESEKARVVKGHHIAEDISKTATADQVFTYSQTDAEKDLGVARLCIVKNRDNTDSQKILISQNYRTGQFAIDSAQMVSRYWNDLEAQHDSEDSHPAVS